MADPLKFFREARLEWAKISWPTRKETVQATIMVFIMVALVSLFFLVVDYMLGIGVRVLLGFGK